MWCPGCNTDSPMVAVLHSGISCARCGTEVLAARPKTAAASKRRAANKSSPDSEGAGAGPRPGIGARLESGTPVFRFDAAHPVTGQAKPEAKVTAPKLPVTHPAVDAPKETRVATKIRFEQPHAAKTARAIADPVADEPRATGSLLFFFAGQFLIAWAWYTSSFPAFAGGIVVTLAGTFGMLRALQAATANNRTGQVLPPATRRTLTTGRNSRTYSRPRSAE